ncbi:hypothetical protein EJB05_49140, partial [Eragrostis curvula]
MGADGAAKSSSPPPRWFLRAAVASRRGLVGWAVDAVLFGFAAALQVRPVGCGMIGGAAVCAAAKRASYLVVPRLALLAVPLFLVRTVGQSRIDADEKKGEGNVNEVATTGHHPESKVEWHKLTKDVNLGPIATGHIILFIFFMLCHSIERGRVIPMFVALFAAVGLWRVYIMSDYVLLTKLNFECGVLAVKA